MKSLEISASLFVAAYLASLAFDSEDVESEKVTEYGVDLRND